MSIVKKRFNNIPRQRCNAKDLINSDKLNPEELFLSDISEEWQKVSGSMSSFQIPDGTGGVNPGDRRAIYYLIRSLQPKTILEIGTHIGASTLCIAHAQKQYVDKANQSKLISVDINDVNDSTKKPWIKFGTNFSPLEMIKDISSDNLVQFICTDSLNYLKNTEIRFDLIFLDGGHSANIVYQEIPAALEVLNNNGVILLHDYFPNLKPLWASSKVTQGPFLAVQRLISEGANIRALPLGRLPWPTKLCSNVTSLALLAKER